MVLTITSVIRRWPAFNQLRHLGHASVQITKDVYSHLLPGVQEAAVAGLDDLLEPALTTACYQNPKKEPRDHPGASF